MNAAVNRSERRAFVAALRSSRTFFIAGLVLAALLPTGAALFTLRSGGGAGCRVDCRAALRRDGAVAADASDSSWIGSYASETWPLGSGCSCLPECRC